MYNPEVIRSLAKGAEAGGNAVLEVQSPEIQDQVAAFRDGIVEQKRRTSLNWFVYLAGGFFLGALFMMLLVATNKAAGA
jgi:hypothetical protein